MLTSAKQTNTNTLDEYSTSRTVEKCTCSHCKKSQTRIHDRQKQATTIGQATKNKIGKQEKQWSMQEAEYSYL